MKGKLWKTAQIISLLQEVEVRRSVTEVCSTHGISEASYYRWRQKFGEMKAEEAVRPAELEQENARLKRLLADSMLDQSIAL